MKTKATDSHPEIEWDDLKFCLLEKDPDERMEVFVCEGTGADGKGYSGIAYFICDEFEKIEEIEEA